MAEFYRVREAFAVGNAVYTAGLILSDSNPVVKGREQFLEPIASYVSRIESATETATSAPGEVRSVRRIGRPRKHQPAPVPVPDPAPAVGVETESEF